MRTPTHIAYSVEEVSFHDSEEAAIGRIKAAIQDARSDAINSDDGEWPCDCEHWFVAKITHRAFAEVDECGTEYVLEDVA